MSFVTSWKVVGASVAGSSHLVSGRGCDDANSFRKLEDGSLVLAVADGAGVASHSAAGAKCVVATALEAAETLLKNQEPQADEQWEQFLTAILQRTRIALEDLAETAQADNPKLVLSDFATTLVLAVVTASQIAVVQVGDGAAVIQAGATDLETLTQPEYGEYLNETTFVTSNAYLDKAQYALYPVQAVRGLALLTDGLQMLALNLSDNKAHAPFFTPLFTFAASDNANEARLAAFLASERICARTDDDKTLLLAVKI